MEYNNKTRFTVASIPQNHANKFCKKTGVTSYKCVLKHYVFISAVVINGNVYVPSKKEDGTIKNTFICFCIVFTGVILHPYNFQINTRKEVLFFVVLNTVLLPF